MNRLSATALILLIGLTVFTQSTQKRRLQPATFNLQPVHLQPSHISLATLGLILFILVGWGLPSLRVSGLEQLEAQGRQAGYENGLVLLDYTIEAREMPADEQMPILLVLKTDRPLDADMQTLIRLIDTDGNVWTTKDALKPRIYRQYYGSRAWLVDQYAEDMLLVDPIPGTPPGLYRLELVIFDKDSLAPAVLTSGESGFNLGTVQLTRPNGAESITIQQTADGRFGPVSLIGYALDRAKANSGDPFKMTLSWRSDQVTNDDLVADIQLLDPAGNVAFSRAISPVRGDWPTSRWQAGDRWLGQHPFRLPAALTSGEHQWRVCIQADCEMVGSLAVTAPDRTFDRPEAVDQTFDAQFGDVAKLIGLNQTFNDGVQEFTLFWEPTAETETSYRVFVQLLGPDGSVRAQSDQEPARWTRPTTGWAVGEVVADQHALRIPDLLLPTGTYMIIVGLYDPGTGDRLVLPNGESFVEIQRIKSVE